MCWWRLTYKTVNGSWSAQSPSLRECCCNLVCQGPAYSRNHEANEAFAAETAHLQLVLTHQRIRQHEARGAKDANDSMMQLEQWCKWCKDRNATNTLTMQMISSLQPALNWHMLHVCMANPEKGRKRRGHVFLEPGNVSNVKTLRFYCIHLPSDVLSKFNFKHQTPQTSFMSQCTEYSSSWIIITEQKYYH